MEEYKISPPEDIAAIPDKHIRELARDLLKAHVELFKMLEPMGIAYQAMRFRPDGKGDTLISLITT